MNATLIQELMNKTGNGMHDCKRALIEARDDLVQAEAWLSERNRTNFARTDMQRHQWYTNALMDKNGNAK